MKACRGVAVQQICQALVHARVLYTQTMGVLYLKHLTPTQERTLRSRGWNCWKVSVPSVELESSAM